MNKYEQEDLVRFDAASRDYVPAEIESAVKDALVAAFNSGAKKAVPMDGIIDALREMVPMSKSSKETVDRIVAWARDNATPVSYPESPTIAAAAPAGGRVIRARRTS